VKKNDFDPDRKERELRAEADSWDTSSALVAVPGDIPVIDVSDYLTTGSGAALKKVANALNGACETVGFYQLVGHSISPAMIKDTFAAVKAFHTLPIDVKSQILMDRPDWPIGGVGYMPVGERKLPRRKKGNLNAAFLIKASKDVELSDNQWLVEDKLPNFRHTIETYVKAVTCLSLDLLPIYATALGLPKRYFSDAFRDPFWRLRMTHYPPFNTSESDDDFGIAPHVDTTFFTLLLQQSQGLCIYSPTRGSWLRVPHIKDAFIVNSGELLKQWTNDRYLSTKHFANSDGKSSRYSIPFFFNAAADYPMKCLPTCHNADNPPKYPTISYQESQAVAQGE